MKNTGDSYNTTHSIQKKIHKINDPRETFDIDGESSNAKARMSRETDLADSL